MSCSDRSRRAKPLVLRPQPFGDFAHRRSRQQTPTVFGEGILDVARRQSARIQLDRQLLQRFGPSTEGSPDRRDERLGRVPHLWRRVFDQPFRRLDLPGPVPIPVAHRRSLGPRVALAPDRVGDLALQRLLHDQPQRQPDEVRSPRRRAEIATDQSLKLLACPVRCAYSLHRDAPWGHRRQPKARSR